MLLLALLLSGVDRCAVEIACPSDAELIAAAEREDFARTRAYSEDQARRGHRIIVDPARIKGVYAVACSAPAPAPAPSPIVTCAVTIDYANSEQPRSLLLELREGHWVLASPR